MEQAVRGMGPSRTKAADCRTGGLHKHPFKRATWSWALVRKEREDDVISEVETGGRGVTVVEMSR